MNVRSPVMLTIRVALATLALGVGTLRPVAAVPSAQMHEMTGTVQRIDRETLTILTTGESKPTVFAWNTKETKFVRNGAFTSVEALRAGSHVIIHCSHPIFGRPMLYRVVWQTEPERTQLQGQTTQQLSVDGNDDCA
jgi:hypothetical protein